MNRRERLAHLKAYPNNPQKLINWISQNHSEYLSKISRFRETISSLPESVNGYQPFNNFISRALINLLEHSTSELRTNHWGNKVKHNSDSVYLVLKCQQFLTDDAKDKILNTFLDNNKNFQSYGRKIMSGLAADYVPNGDERAFRVLKNFYRILRKDDFTKLMSKIDGGFDNQLVQKILSKTKIYSLYYFNKDKVLSDHATKIKLLKELARTPSLVKKLDYDLKVSIKDIKEIAPAMRFGFLQFIFQNDMRSIRYTSSYQTQYAQQRIKDNREKMKLKMPNISTEEMKDILFSVCIRKNGEVNRWLTDYKKYLDILAGTFKDERYR